jgi:hypothetical protein
VASRLCLRLRAASRSWAGRSGKSPRMGLSARRMGGAQRYPSIAVREVDGFREGLNPSYELLVLFGFALMLRSVFSVGWKLLGYVTPLGILVFIFVAYSVWRIIASGT